MKQIFSYFVTWSSLKWDGWMDLLLVVETITSDRLSILKSFWSEFLFACRSGLHSQPKLWLLKCKKKRSVQNDERQIWVKPGWQRNWSAMETSTSVFPCQWWQNKKPINIKGTVPTKVKLVQLGGRLFRLMMLFFW